MARRASNDIGYPPDYLSIEGETLADMAIRVLGDEEMWPLLHEASGRHIDGTLMARGVAIDHPNTPLPGGLVLSMPDRRALERWESAEV